MDALAGIVLPGVQQTPWSLRTVRITYKPGVLAFRNDKRGPWGETPRLRVERMTVRGKTYKLISFQGGEWEVHRVEPDGLETFVGYAPDAIEAITRSAKP